MADAYNLDHPSENYPYNVVPQVRSPKPTGKMPILMCPPDTSEQFIIMDAHNFAVIRGMEWKANVDLRDWFVPVDSYQTYEFTLPKQTDFTTHVTLSYNPLDLIGEGIKFVMIFPEYHLTELQDQTTWAIHYKFDDDLGTDDDELSWRQIGRCLILSGTTAKPIRPIYLQNHTGYDIPLKILLGN